MIPDLGNLLLYFSLALSAVSIVVNLKAENPRNLLKFNSVALVSSCFAMLVLIWLFVTSDYSVKLVFENSHHQKPLIYRISGAWGNHEGSMLLWVINLQLFNVLYLALSKDSIKVRRLASHIQNFLSVIYLIFLIGYSNPFTRMFPAPYIGKGLNPILQDIGLAMHPPLLYLGYVGFAMVFSITVAHAIMNTSPRVYATSVRPWVLLPWAFLSCGIALGSNWAYRELGWGGYWFWDPVENASLMPWLAATAMIHSLMLTVRRGHFAYFSMLLGVLIFGFSQVGTLIVRSGLITSVHSFALDPSRGYVILAIMGLITGAGLIAISFIKPTPTDQPNYREFSLYLGSLMIKLLALIVLFGTLYPLLHELLSGENIAIGPDFFNALFMPFVMLSLIAMIVATSGISKPRALLATAIFIFMNYINFNPAAWFLIVLCGLVIFDSARKLIMRGFLQPSPIAHMGVAILIIAVIHNSIGRSEEIFTLSPGQKAQSNNFTIELDSLTVQNGANYIAKVGLFNLYHHNSFMGKVSSEQRYYPVEKQLTTEVGIYTTRFYDAYIALGNSQEDGSVSFRFYFLPSMTFIWIGYFLISMAGFLACIKRFRNLLATLNSIS